MSIRRRKTPGKRYEYQLKSGEWATLNTLYKRGVMNVSIKDVSARLTVYFIRESPTSRFKTIEDMFTVKKVKTWSRKKQNIGLEKDLFATLDSLMPVRVL